MGKELPPAAQQWERNKFYAGSENILRKKLLKLEGFLPDQQVLFLGDNSDAPLLLAATCGRQNAEGLILSLRGERDLSVKPTTERFREGTVTQLPLATQAIYSDGILHRLTDKELADFFNAANNLPLLTKMRHTIRVVNGTALMIQDLSPSCLTVEQWNELFVNNGWNFVAAEPIEDDNPYVDPSKVIFEFQREIKNSEALNAQQVGF